MNVGEIRAAAITSAAPGAAPRLALVPAQAPTPAPPPTDDKKIALPTGGRWARYAGKLGAALTVTVSSASIRKGGHEPNEPDDSDVELLQEALEEGLRMRFGDAGIPWWLGAGLAAGGVYAGMRVGAAKLPPKTPAELTPEAPQAAPPIAAPAARSNVFPTPMGSR